MADPAATIGNVYTSERSALLLRWHVKRPADLVRSDVEGGVRVYRAATNLRTAFAAAKKVDTKLAESPTQWGDPGESLSIAAIKTNLPADDGLPGYHGKSRQLATDAVPELLQTGSGDLPAVGETRSSFHSDYSQLPVPDYTKAVAGK